MTTMESWVIEAVPGASMKPSALYLALGPVRAGCGQSVSQPQPWSASSQFRKTHVQLWPVALCVFGERAASYIVQEVQVSS